MVFQNSQELKYTPDHLASLQATYETLENTGDPENEVFNPIAEEESKSSTFGATMNFINAIVGAGIVGR